jgi:translation initiation factor 2 subunit 1
MGYKDEFPDEGDLVLCTISGIQHHAVFCRLDEYNGRTGMIHISEVVAGRVRNLKEYVKEGQKAVVKVLRVNKEKGYIDLSLRRVNEGQRRQKMNQLKQLQLCKKIIGIVAKQLKKDENKILDHVSAKVSAKYAFLFEAFEAVSRDEDSFEKIGVDATLSKALTEAVKIRIKPPELFIEGDFTLSSYDPNGIELIKKALVPFEKEENCTVKYRGAGTYRIKIKTDDYKKGEKQLKPLVENIEKFCKKNKVEYNFARVE